MRMLKSSLNVLLLFALWALSSAFVSGTTTHVKRNSTGLTDAVTWDPFSLFIKGQRTFILSAEYHPWRLPNPDLWADVFEKIKANGFNTVSFYVHWALHYPTPDTNNGAGDFQVGTYRDIQRFIDEAKKAGLWLIARPGPYINAETTGGGFPGWVGNIAGSLRTNSPDYTQAWTPYMTEISKIIARNQVTEGGPIILVQAENEFSAGANRSPYMQQIIDLYRANGIVVPITHNDQHGGGTGNYSPDLPGTGRVDIYCGDSYPQSTRWTQVPAIYYPYHLTSAPSNPLCLAEFGGGWLLGWASGPPGGTGYEKFTSDLTGPAYENIFYKENYAQTTKILNIYMLYGGTNWGQTAEPTVYSSYDYGAGINENRVATAKMNEMRLQGLFLRVSRDFLAASYIANGTNYTSTPLVHTAELRNLETNAGFYIIRQNTSTSTNFITATLNVSTSVGNLTIPKNGTIALDGRESKILVTDYVFGQSNSKVIYTTTEIFTWTTGYSIGRNDYIVLYAPTSQTGETSISLLGSSIPKIDTSAATGVTYSVTNNTVTFNYVLGDGIKQLTLSSGNSSVVVVILDKATANLWHAPILPGEGTFGNFFSIGTNSSVLVGGPYLVRTASISGKTLSLTGDLNGTTDIEFYAPPSVNTLSWNGQVRAVSKTARGSFATHIESSPTVSLPSLSSWKVSGSLPEIGLDFDDSSFVTANLTSTNYTSLPPLAGKYVLYSQQYGFYGGNLIWRGHFNASGSETAFNLTVQGGFGFAYSAYLNGVFLGSGFGNATVSQTTNMWSIPEGALEIGKDNVLTVIQDHTGIVETSTNSGKEPRGIRGYSIIGGNTTFSYWKLQGNQGGAAHAPDQFRGYLNEGGLYAERVGAHLPGYPDSGWSSGSPLASEDGGVKGAGVNFYRTTFDLNMPIGYDIPIRLAITPSATTSRYRAQIYLNGWQLGKYINDLGPQTVFVLPAGLLKTQSSNTLAISLWSLDSAGAALAGLELISDGTFATALHINDYKAPGYTEQRLSRPKGKVYKAM